MSAASADNQHVRVRPRFNVIEVVLVLVGVAVLSYFSGKYRAERYLRPFLPNGSSELRPLAEKYGPSRNSEHGEEWIVRDFFEDQRGGVFVDVGANDYRRDSNTYYLETALGWSGIAIEPQEKFAADYMRHRPHTRFVPLFVSDVSDKDVTLYVPTTDLLASGSRAVAEERAGQVAVAVKSRSATLDDILAKAGANRTDFVSIDVEEHEPQVLRGFSIDAFKPRLVCIEAHPAVRQAILDYFAAHQYVLVGKYLRADSENLWFQTRSMVPTVSPVNAIEPARPGQ